MPKTSISEHFLPTPVATVSYRVHTYHIIVQVLTHDIKSLWRNGLAHWTSNSKVVGSTPTRDTCIFFFFQMYMAS